MKSDDVQLLYILGCCQMRLRWSMGSIDLERSLFNTYINTRNVPTPCKNTHHATANGVWPMWCFLCRRMCTH